MNEQIKVPNVLLIDAEGKKIGIIPTDKARKMANDQDLDLVEVSPSAYPPVCRIMDYGKYIYEQEKLAKKQKVSKIQLKEIRIGPLISEHDLEIKKSQAEKFLHQGHMLRISMKLVGRQLKFKDRAGSLLVRFAQSIENGAIEGTMTREGNRFFTNIIPKK